MSNRSNQGSGSHQAQRPVRHLVATAAVISGAGIVLGAPVAALFIGSGVAQAAPLVSAPTDLCSSSLAGCNDPSASSLFGASTALTVIPAGPGISDPFGLADAFFDLAGSIPGLNLFIGNGADGTAEHPDGFNGGLFAGSGGNGYSPAFGANGGNGGSGGLFIGNGGNGGNGLNGVNRTTTDTAGTDATTGNGQNGVGLQNGGRGRDGGPGSNAVAEGHIGGMGGNLGGNDGNGGNGADHAEDNSAGIGG